MFRRSFMALLMTTPCLFAVDFTNRISTKTTLCSPEQKIADALSDGLRKRKIACSPKALTELYNYCVSTLRLPQEDNTNEVLDCIDQYLDYIQRIKLPLPYGENSPQRTGRDEFEDPKTMRAFCS